MAHASGPTLAHVGRSPLSSLAFGSVSLATAVELFPDGQSDFERLWWAERSASLLMRLIERLDTTAAVRVAAACVRSASEASPGRCAEVADVVSAVEQWLRGERTAEAVRRAAGAAEEMAAEIVLTMNRSHAARSGADLATAHLCFAAQHLSTAPSKPSSAAAAVIAAVDCVAALAQSQRPDESPDLARQRAEDRILGVIRAHATVPALTALLAAR